MMPRHRPPQDPNVPAKLPERESGTWSGDLGLMKHALSDMVHSVAPIVERPASGWQARNACHGCGGCGGCGGCDGFHGWRW